MNKNIVLLAETGSDITPEIAQKYGIYIVPMHVQMGDVTKDDGTFPPEEVCEYYEKTGKVPKTSGSTPEDFEIILNRIHKEHPEKHIFYLAYSAVTTCSFHSCVISSDGRDYITCYDTKQVSVGQAAFVVEVAEFLKSNPEATVEEAVMALTPYAAAASIFGVTMGAVCSLLFLVLRHKIVGDKITKEELDVFAAQFSNERAEYYDLTEENIEKYITLENLTCNSFDCPLRPPI